MMRSLFSSWLPALAAVAQAASSSGDIYFYDQHARTPSQHHHTIDSKTAGLILASRFGVAQYHELGVVSDDSLSVINEFGSQKKLFDSSASRTPVALLLATSDENKLESHTQKLLVSSMPSLEKTKSLFFALAEQQKGYLSSGQSQSNPEWTAESIIDIVSSASNIGTLTRRYQSQGYDVILVVSPATSTASSNYGSWTLPSSLHKRQSEEPLEDFSLTASDNDTVSASKSNSSDPLRGILPACYSSKSACEATTRNCTGHGSCRLAYTQKDNAGDSSGVPCYSCACTPSIRQNKDGSKKTTVWGGPACQKKDVTTPFWLLASFSVFMVFLISWGVGTIWSMGEEELPSVIGAGVSGAPRK